MPNKNILSVLPCLSELLEYIWTKCKCIWKVIYHCVNIISVISHDIDGAAWASITTYGCEQGSNGLSIHHQYEFVFFKTITFWKHLIFHLINTSKWFSAYILYADIIKSTDLHTFVLIFMSIHMSKPSQYIVIDVPVFVGSSPSEIINRRRLMTTNPLYEWMQPDLQKRTLNTFIPFAGDMFSTQLIRLSSQVWTVIKCLYELSV